jgi:hypothetical protein
MVAEGAAFATVRSSADAFVAYAAPASPRNIAAETPNRFISPPPDRFEYNGREVVPGLC